MRNERWPLFDLEVRTPRLTLRYLDDVLAEQLLAVAAAGVHDPATMPFTIPWTDMPSPTSRAATRPESWNLLFAVVVDDAVIGSIDLRSNEFPQLREFGTGSWIGREFQGRGYGKELRVAALALGFDGLGAQVAHTAAWYDNAASLGVTRSLGYELVGTKRALRRGEPDDQLAFRMSRDHWTTIRRHDITLHGVDVAREFLGL
jgi:RimJ/RimL family protein N-acetyltransferase